jgi:DNA-binding transcriptional LysR family regulator
VTLTPAGEALLPRTRALLEQADELRRAAAGLSAHEPVRLGYVNWCPADLTSRATGVAQLLVDTWVLPSHTQAARVADGSIDLAICWVRAEDLATYGLEAQLLGADRLYAVAAGRDASPVRARDTAVLVDADETSWLSWNIYAAEFLADTGATRIPSRTVASPDQRSSTMYGGFAAHWSTRPRDRQHQSRRTWSSGRSSRLRRIGPGPWSGAGPRVSRLCWRPRRR